MSQLSRRPTSKALLQQGDRIPATLRNQFPVHGVRLLWMVARAPYHGPMSLFILNRWCSGVNQNYPLSAGHPPGIPTGLRYHRLSHYLSRQFGSRVWKVSVDAGFDCPNRDGTLGRGGCVFCDPAAFSPSRRQPAGSITEQIDAGNRAAAARQRHRPVPRLFPAGHEHLRAGRPAAGGLRRGPGAPGGCRLGHRHPARLRGRRRARSVWPSCRAGRGSPSSTACRRSTTGRSTGCAAGITTTPFSTRWRGAAAGGCRSGRT